MKKGNLITYFMATGLLLLTSGLLKAEEINTALNLTDADAVITIEGEPVQDSELLEINGKGADGIVPGRPETISVILWDEKGGGKKSVQHNSISGSGNVQNVSVTFDRN